MDASVTLLVAVINGVECYAVEVLVDGELVSFEEFASHEDALDECAAWRMVFEAAGLAVN